MPAIPSGRSRLGGLVTAACVVLAVLVGLFVIVTGIASYKSSQVERRWAGTFGTRGEILARHPSGEANRAALELERLTAILGIDTATRSHEGRDRPTPEARRRIRELAGEMGDYRRRRLEMPRREAGAPPARTAALLETHAADLAAIRRHLIGGELPRWEMRLDRVTQAPVPNLLGHLELQRILVADALAAIAADERERALDDLEAAWRLMGALEDHPFLITQLIVLVDARLVAGTLRQIETVPPIWRERLAGHDFRAAFAEALKYEGWYWTQIGDGGDLTSLGGIANKLLYSVAEPYFRYYLAKESDAFRERLAKLDGVRALCDYDLAMWQADLQVPVPRVFGGLVMPDLGGTLDRLARLEFDLELTLKLLELEEARRTAGGRWPDSLPGGERSSACPKDRWIYEVSSGEGMTLAFHREISWDGVRGPTLPTRFSVAP